MEEEEGEEEEEDFKAGSRSNSQHNEEDTYENENTVDFRKKIKVSSNEILAQRLEEKYLKDTKDERNENQNDSQGSPLNDPFQVMPPSQMDLLLMGVEDQIDSLTLTDKNQQQWSLNGRTIRKQMLDNMSLIYFDTSKSSLHESKKMPNTSSSIEGRSEQRDGIAMENYQPGDRQICDDIRKEKKVYIMKKKQGQMKKFLFHSSANFGTSPTKSKLM